MAERITIEQDQHDDGTPCACSDCDWKGPVEALDAPDGAVLTPGDASPAGRCPACGSLAYLDTPQSRAEDAFRDLLRLKTWHPDDAATRVAALEAAFNEAMAGASIRVEMLLVRGTHNVEFEDADGDTLRYPVIANDALDAVVVAWGARRANEFDIRKGPDGFDPRYAMQAYPDCYSVDAVFPFGGGSDESESLRKLASIGVCDPISLDDVLKVIPEFDNAVAITEGWEVVTDEDAGTFSIRAFGDTFASDNAALFHVVTLAQAESPYHCRAVARIGLENARHE